jgi:hypothetical protein
VVTLLKVNILTDDDGLPAELHDQLVALLQRLAKDDPEGPEHAKILLEWKQSIFPRSYMESLPTPMKAEAVAVPKTRARSGKGKAHPSRLTER